MRTIEYANSLLEQKEVYRDRVKSAGDGFDDDLIDHFWELTMEEELKPVFKSSPSQFITVVYSVEYKDAGKDPMTISKPDIYVLKLLNVVGSKTLTVKDVMERLNLKGSDNFRKKYLNPAIKGGYIALLYPEKPKKKGQAYYLTDLGKALLEKE